MYYLSIIIFTSLNIFKSLFLGNQTLNKNIKEQLKKKKKQNARNEKKVAKIADVLDNFSLSTSKDDDKYDFDQDYVIE